MKSHSDIFLRGTSISLFGNMRKSCVHTLDRILNLDNYCYHSNYLSRSYSLSMYSLKQRRHYSTMKMHFFVQILLQPILAKNLLPTRARSIVQQLNTFKKQWHVKHLHGQCIFNRFFQMNEIAFKFHVYLSIGVVAGLVK